jgi:hypothetical protein
VISAATPSWLAADKRGIGACKPRGAGRAGEEGGESGGEDACRGTGGDSEEGEGEELHGEKATCAHLSDVLRLGRLHLVCVHAAHTQSPPMSGYSSACEVLFWHSAAIKNGSSVGLLLVVPWNEYVPAPA